MTRLASRSPAAPFSTSRPAPMPQYPPQSTTTTEAQTLRQMVQKREEKIRELKRASKSNSDSIQVLSERIKHARRAVDLALHSLEESTSVSDDLRTKLKEHLEEAIDALDGGGDNHATG